MIILARKPTGMWNEKFVDFSREKGQLESFREIRKAQKVHEVLIFKQDSLLMGGNHRIGFAGKVRRGYPLLCGMIPLWRLGGDWVDCPFLFRQVERRNVAAPQPLLLLEEVRAKTLTSEMHEEPQQLFSKTDRKSSHQDVERLWFIWKGKEVFLKILPN